MRKTIILKPKEGRQVRKPDASALAKDGEEVIYNAYWHRRIKDGDVIVLKSLPKVKSEKAKQPVANSSEES
ncbi:DUF2635 domain-containing protein [Vibrio scophthalmi]|uniref:DUF2635 domain-containing protein n=1 Tax=Vibrio scophthalmi TaxID=45658 RepID=UPI003AAFAEEB